MIKTIKLISSVFLLVLTLIYLKSSGQTIKSIGVPAIKNYTTEDYNYDPQNWDILQDNRGILFFGNTKGLLVFDGTNWRTYESPNKAVIRSLIRGIDGRIYYGLQGDFGYIKIDSNAIGNLQFHSLLHKIPKQHQDFIDVWTLVHTPDALIIETSNKIFLVKNNGQTKVFKSEPGFHVTFYVDSTLYVREWDKGILILNGNSLELIPDGEKFANERVYSMLPFEVNKSTNRVEKLLIIAQNSGAFIYDKKKITKWNIPANKLLIESRVYFGITISDKYFAFGTGQNGIIIINKKGELVQLINKNAGLQSNNINKIYLDKNDNLWAALDNGISFIETNSPFSYYTEELSNLPNKQVVSEIHNNILYIATEQGIYYKDWNVAENTLDELNQFQLIKNTEGQIWSFQKINNKLYASRNPGLLLIDGKSANLHSFPYTNVWNVLKLSKHPGFVLAGTSMGFELLEIVNNKLIWKVTINGYNQDSRNFNEDNVGNIWFSNSLKGVYKARFNEQLDSLLILDFYDSKNGLPSDFGNIIVENKFHILSRNENGIYIYDENENNFKEYVQFNKHIDEFKNFDVFDCDEEGNFWFVNNGQIGYMEKQNNGEFIYHNITYNKFKSLKILQVDKYNDSTIFIETNKELIHYNPKIKIRIGDQYPALIRKIEIISTDSLLFNGNFVDKQGNFILKQQNKLQLELPYKYNSLRFNFTALYYEDNDKIKYATILKGFDKDWSDWTNEVKKEYINIPVGDFAFMVKAKNVYQKESDIASYNFTILPPWYRTNLAYIIYVLLVIVIIRLIIIIYTKRLKQANIRLEDTVKLRTFEIEQQKEEILSQAEQLALSNKELEKLSIVASETNNGVIIMDPDFNIEWINEGFTKMLGYNFEQLIAEIGNNLRITSFNTKINEKLNQLKQKKKTIIYEAQNVTRNSKKIWVQTTITPILNDKNEIIKLIAIESDVTKLKKAEREIIKQRDAIFKQKKEITDSIIYSKHIQKAILPETESLKKIIPESFIFNRPKEIIGGDFYWLTKKKKKIIIAVADCTGHGVPGALMSMLGVTLLNEIVLSKNIYDAGKILDELKTKMIKTLHQTKDEKSSNDGMDMALCVFEPGNNKVKYAGANIPFIICRSGEFTELMPDKMHIRLDQYIDTPFNVSEFNYTKDDTFYLFSDGYADQFGGNDDRKLLKSNFKKILSNASNLAINKQLEYISTTFDDWKGNNEQIDDVMVLGFKI